MADYSKMTQDEFFQILGEIIEEEPACNILSVNSVYEALSEEYNNEVLDRWLARQTDNEENS